MDIATSSVRQFAWLCAALTVLIVGLSALAYVVVDRQTYPALFDYFYVGTEMNLPTWWNVVLLLGLAASAWLAAGQRPAERVGWISVAVTAIALSLDEGSRLHENLGNVVRGASIATFSWVIPGAVLAVIGAGALTILTRGLPRTTRRALGAAAAVYIVAALGLETVAGFLHGDGQWGAYLVLTHLEELMEMLSAVFAASVVLARLTPLSIERGDEGAAVPSPTVGSSTT